MSENIERHYGFYLSLKDYSASYVRVSYKKRSANMTLGIVAEHDPYIYVPHRAPNDLVVDTEAVAVERCIAHWDEVILRAEREAMSFREERDLWVKEVAGKAKRSA